MTELTSTLSLDDVDLMNEALGPVRAAQAKLAKRLKKRGGRKGKG
jgi:hypothetical protein